MADYRQSLIKARKVFESPKLIQKDGILKCFLLSEFLQPRVLKFEPKQIDEIDIIEFGHNVFDIDVINLDSAFVKIVELAKRNQKIRLNKLQFRLKILGGIFDYQEVIDKILEKYPKSPDEYIEKNHNKSASWQIDFEGNLRFFDPNLDNENSVNIFKPNEIDIYNGEKYKILINNTVKDENSDSNESDNNAYHISNFCFSTVPWTMSNLEQIIDGNINYDDFKNRLNEMNEAINLVNISSLVDFIKEAINIIKKTITNPLHTDDKIRIALYLTHKASIDKYQIKYKDNLLNSFYIDDLLLVNKSGNNNLLDLYFNTDEINEFDRADILQSKSVNFIKKHLNIEKFPLASFPSKFTLNFSQQFSINAIMDLLNDGGMYSVNGPPGTGKTAILRDLLVAIYIRRAAILATMCEDEIFVITRDGTTHYRLNSKLIGNEIVIVSSNNLAVQNLTNDTAFCNTIDEKYLSLFDYFRFIATSLNNAIDISKSLETSKLVNKDGNNTKYCWSMVSAMFGNSRNMNIFNENFNLNRFISFDIYHEDADKYEASDELKNNIDKLFRYIVDEFDQMSCGYYKDGTILKPLLNSFYSHIYFDQYKSKNYHDYFMENIANSGNPFDSKFDIKDFETAKSEFNDTLKRVQNLMANAKDDEITLLSEENFYQNLEKREKSSPHLMKNGQKTELANLRVELFAKALELHKAALFSKSVKSALWCNKKTKLATMDKPNMKFERDYLQTLFFIIPAIGTTFASFARTFGAFGKDEIGWLLIDEAGQASLPSAVGALFRSKRAVIVGDPIQLLPINLLPNSLNQKFMRDLGVPSEFDISEVSVQMRADKVQKQGAYIRQNGKPIWVGSPLRVHKRCGEPMFSLANHIAYGGMMIADVPQRDGIVQSTWHDVRTPQSRWMGNLSLDERKKFYEIWKQLAGRRKNGKQISVITPFVDVSEGISKAHTIHTMQGREADIVVLILGGQRDGALRWASRRPNLLNVALTRAKESIIIIGDKSRWGAMPYFRDVAQAL